MPAICYDKDMHIGIGVFLGISVFFGAHSFAHAESLTLPDPGLTPESPVYFLDIWDEKLRLFFTRSDSSRFERYMSHILERLSEAEALSGRGISATQQALELYRTDMPFLYATAERLGDKVLFLDVLRMATDHLDVLDKISERTEFEKKRFILATKKFVIDQQLQTLQVLSKQEPSEALRIFGDALERRMARIREVAIDDENNEEALSEYAAYMSEVDRILREWKTGKVDGKSSAAYLAHIVRGHEETLLGPVRERLPTTLENELLFVVNSVRKLSGKELLLELHPLSPLAGSVEETLALPMPLDIPETKEKQPAEELKNNLSDTNMALPPPPPPPL